MTPPRAIIPHTHTNHYFAPLAAESHIFSAVPPPYFIARARSRAPLLSQRITAWVCHLRRNPTLSVRIEVRRNAIPKRCSHVD